MPKKKRNGQNVVGAGYLSTVADCRKAENGSKISGGLPLPSDSGDRGLLGKDEIMKNMQEMFSHLDPEVVYMVLSECDFKVEKAMDSMLEMSAERATLPSSSVSGFETAAALLELKPGLGETVPAIVSGTVPAKGKNLDGIGTYLTADFDVLIDKELAGVSTSSSLPPPEPQQALPELLQSSVQYSVRDGEYVPMGGSGSHSPANGLSFTGAEPSQEPLGVLDFSHLTSELTSSNASLDLAGRGRPSAFQAYRKGPEARTSAGVQCVESIVCGVTSQAPTPSFITPVVNPGPWNASSALCWLHPGFAVQPPVKPAATIPQSWTVPAAPKHSQQPRPNRLIGQLLVLMRGAPGSGKSTLARSILEDNPGGVMLSTDDYFSRDGFYHFDQSELVEAHEWNHKRAKDSFEKGVSPIIIDNTNMQGWEMKPYVSLALQYNYKVMFREPDTRWKFKPRELERRNKHGVTKERIRHMLDHYERHVSVASVMRSFRRSPEPGRSAAKLHQGESSLSPPSSSDVKPDLVEEPHLNLGLAKGNFQLFSSLPDVSSVIEGSITTENSHTANESLLTKDQVSQFCGAPELGSAQLREAWASDWELDSSSASSKGSQAVATQLTPEFSGAEQENEKPVAFFESIGQRERRHRANARLVNTTTNDDAILLNHSALREESVNGGDVESADCGNPVIDDTQPELLEFVGDWPLEALEQRTREENFSQPPKDDSQLEQVDCRAETDGDSGSQKTEFQKLLDLLQISIDSSPKCVNPSVNSHGSSLVSSALHSSFEDLTLEPGSSVKEALPSKEGSKGLCMESRPELLDCVVDWTGGELVPVKTMPQSPTGGESIIKTPCATEQEDDVLSLAREGGISTPEKSEDLQSGNLKDLQSPSGRMAGNLVTQGASSAETEGNPTASSPGSSQMRRLRQNRRLGKHCRLALTFSNNSSTAPQLPPESPLSTSLCLTFPRRPASSSTACKSFSTQTNPQDFALLWRLDRQYQTNTDGLGVNVIKGDSTRFLPKPAGALECSDCPDVPYRVVHDKGAQVEEQELSIGDNKLQNLQILSRHFKLVSFDILEDLYEKCHQDMEWTTNLLLDSGEQLFKDDEDDGSVGSDPLSQAGEDGLHTAVESFSADIPVLNAEQPNALNSSEVRYTSSDGSLEVLGADSGGKVGLIAAAEQLNVQSDELRLESCDVTEPVSKEGPMNSAPVQDDRVTHSTLDTTIPLLMGSRQSEVMLGDMKGTSEKQSNEATALLKAEEQAAFCVVEFESDVVTDDIGVEESVGQGLRQLEELNKKEEEHTRERQRMEDKRDHQAKHYDTTVDIQSLELKLPTELALQLSELFGPVGIDPGTLTPEDCLVQIDLNLAQLLHQKWKDTIQERHRQEALSYQLLQESSIPFGEYQSVRPDGLVSLGQPDTLEDLPFMDHWNASLPHISLRDIMTEEEALQQNMYKYRSSHVEVGKRDSVILLKEKQLYSMFPTIDRHFLKDMFRDHNYSLEQTEQFLRSVLDQGPVKTVVALETPLLRDVERSPSKESRQKAKAREPPLTEFQDTEDPEYEDFRAEAALQWKKQQECFSKAADAYRQGMKEVASFYSQQGHLHGQKMKEANHRAAIQIFERVNSSLLPQNVLDLHGLHVDEALHHLGKVLEQKTAEWQQGGCRPQLSVITGRGSHSQGGVARIRPAVIDYLSSHKYRFTEPKLGLVLVTLH